MFCAFLKKTKTLTSTKQHSEKKSATIQYAVINMIYSNICYTP